MSPATQGLTDHQKGLLLTSLGVLVLTPDSLLVRLIDAEPFTLLVWRGALQALGILAILAVQYRGRLTLPFRAIGRAGLLLAGCFYNPPLRPRCSPAAPSASSSRSA